MICGTKKIFLLLNLPVLFSTLQFLDVRFIFTTSQLLAYKNLFQIKHYIKPGLALTFAFLQYFRNLMMIIRSCSTEQYILALEKP